MDLLLELDGNILLWIQNNVRHELITPVMTIVTSLGNAGIFWIALILLLLIYKKTRKTGVLALISLLITFIITNLWLKVSVARIRPYEVLEGLNILIPKQVDYSFPSGHAANGMACAVIFFRRFPGKYGVPLLVLQIIICLSRLYVGVHYPSDVLVGMFIGTIVAISVMLVDKRIENHKRGE